MSVEISGHSYKKQKITKRFFLFVLSGRAAFRHLIFLAVMCSLVSILFSLFYLHSPVHPVSRQSSFIERKSAIRGTTDTPDMQVIKSADRADKWRGIRWWDLLKGGTRPSCGPEAKPRVFCVRSIGRLGNSLFSYASSLGVAMLVNASLLLWPEYVGLLPHLSLRGGIDNNLTVCRRALVRPERTCCIFQKTLVQAGRTCGRVQQLGGYLQSWRYFQHAQQEVRKDFQFRGIVLSSAQLIIGRIRRFNSFLYHEDHHRGDKRLAIENRKRNSVSRGMNVTPVTVVGIHVRHGDITINRQQIQMGYQTPPVEYYVRAMLYFRRRYGHVFYVITTDSRKYVMNYLLPACFRIGARCHLTKNNVFVDLAILASCDHVIMSVGTFGWWAAWLAGGEVVYYKYPAREGSVLRKYMNYSDFYPDRWIAME